MLTIQPISRRRVRRALLALLAALGAVLGSPAAAEALLQPDEVVIVVNARVPHSVALGRFYADKRSLPADNLIELELPETPEISSEDYRTLLVEPLRKILQERKLDAKARCLLLIYGVPYQLAAGPNPPEYDALLDWCQRAHEDALRHFHRNIQLMERVGREIPATAEPDTPLDRLDLLLGPLGELPPTSPTPEAIARRLGALGTERVAEIRATSDPRRQTLAIRQMVAIYVDTYGQDAWSLLTSQLGDLAPVVPGSLATQREILAARQKELTEANRSDEAALKDLAEITRKLSGWAGLISFARGLNHQIADRNTDSRAAVDNELALMNWEDYVREAALPNPLHWTILPRLEWLEHDKGRVMMVCRLDAPAATDVMKMVLASLETEAKGLDGQICLDYGGRQTARANALYATLAEELQRYTELEIVKEDSVMYFAPGGEACRKAAVYIGHYFPRHYMDAFTFVPGAVAYHLGVGEGDDLRDPASPAWAVNLIRHGAAAVMADVYGGGFSCYPPAQEFVPMLLSGRLTLCEAYWRSLPHSSWRCMLIGDPLYNPFARRPQSLPVSETMLPR